MSANTRRNAKKYSKIIEEVRVFHEKFIYRESQTDVIRRSSRIRKHYGQNENVKRKPNDENRTQVAEKIKLVSIENNSCANICKIRFISAIA